MGFESALSGQYAKLGVAREEHRAATVEGAGYASEIGYVGGMGALEVKRIGDIGAQITGAVGVTGNLLDLYIEGSEFQESKKLVQESLAAVEAESEYSDRIKDVKPSIEVTEEYYERGWGGDEPLYATPWKSLPLLEREAKREPFLAKHEFTRVKQRPWEDVIKGRRYQLGGKGMQYTGANITAAGKFIRGMKLHESLGISGGDVNPLYSYLGYGK
jgi:hypothetical protein